MPIQNINALQNAEDIKYINGLSVTTDDSATVNSDYYIHALANLEQRNEYRYSNGIKYNILKFDEDVERTNKDIVPIYELIDDVRFDNLINNVEVYKKHSQLFDDGNNFKTLLYCKTIGSEDVNDIEIQYIDIDISIHRLIESYKIFHLNNDVYCAIHIYIVDKNKIDATQLEYELECILYNIDSNQNLTISSVFNSSSYNISSENDEFIMTDVNVNNFVEKFIESDLKKYRIYTDEQIYNNYTVKCEYDTIDEELIKITSADMFGVSFTNMNELLYFNYYTINDYVNSFNNDLRVTYPNLLKYYSNKRFNNNSELLKQTVATELFTQIYNELKKDNDTEFNNSMELVIPAGTTINYISNVENDLTLYYTDDIYVNFVEDKPNNTSEYKNQSGIKFYYKDDNKTIIYNVYAKYNTLYTDFIDSLLVNKKYILPFINDSNLWEINGVQTAISAIGENAGNPNIIIMKTDVDESNGTLKTNYLNRFDLSELNVISYTEDNITYNINGVSKTYAFYIPDLSSVSTNFFKFANLIVISNIIKIKFKDDNDVQMYDKSSYRTAFYTIKTIDGQSKFAHIELDNDEPLTIDNMLSMREYIGNEFDRYQLNVNHFDDLAAIHLRREIINGTTTDPDPAPHYLTLQHIDLTDENNCSLFDLGIGDTVKGDSNNYHFSYIQYNDTTNLVDYWYISGRPTSRIYSYVNISKTEINDINNDKDNYSLLVSRDEQNGKKSQYGVSLMDNIKYINVNKETKLCYYDEWIPSRYVPIIKKSNVLELDTNILNRSSIYSMNKDGNIYYSYIGSSINDPDKSVLHMGTFAEDTNEIINLGQDSLINNKSIISKTNTLSVDFRKIYLNSNETDISFANIHNEIRTDDDLGMKTVVIYNIKQYADDSSFINKINDAQFVKEMSSDKFTSFTIKSDDNKYTHFINYITSDYNIELSSDDITVHIENDTIKRTGYVLKIQNTNKFVLMLSSPLIINIIDNKIYIMN